MFSSYRNLNLSLFPATCETKPTDPEGDISVQPADLFWQFEIWLMAQFLCSGPERSLQLSSSYMKHLHCSDCWCNSLSRISSLRPSKQTRLCSASERLFPFCLLQIKLFFFFHFLLDQHPPIKVFKMPLNDQKQSVDQSFSFRWSYDSVLHLRLIKYNI